MKKAMLGLAVAAVVVLGGCSLLTQEQLTRVEIEPGGKATVVARGYRFDGLGIVARTDPGGSTRVRFEDSKREAYATLREGMALGMEAARAYERSRGVW